MALNGITNPDHIEVGQKLKIPQPGEVDPDHGRGHRGTDEQRRLSHRAGHPECPGASAARP